MAPHPAPSNQPGSDPFWNPRSGVFDGGQLRLAIVTRGWTVAEFAATAKVSLACMYSALGGTGVSDRTAIRIFQGLAMRQPMLREQAKTR